MEEMSDVRGFIRASLGTPQRWDRRTDAVIPAHEHRHPAGPEGGARAGPHDSSGPRSSPSSSYPVWTFPGIFMYEMHSNDSYRQSAQPGQFPQAGAAGLPLTGPKNVGSPGLPNNIRRLKRMLPCLQGISNAMAETFANDEIAFGVSVALQTETTSTSSTFLGDNFRRTFAGSGGIMDPRTMRAASLNLGDLKNVPGIPESPLIETYPVFVFAGSYRSLYVTTEAADLYFDWLSFAETCQRVGNQIYEPLRRAAGRGLRAEGEPEPPRAAHSGRGDPGRGSDDANANVPTFLMEHHARGGAVVSWDVIQKLGRKGVKVSFGSSDGDDDDRFRDVRSSSAPCPRPSASPSTGTGLPTTCGGARSCA
ncbi:hypothetical protein SLS62_010663 [Diatrype stigma]|uniref:Uncharacterized protein n=1 Tax=Diatrype stigma TaxID=117547 RepID=A0AAN9U8K1_9PEZI